jgi:hypothetical protein
MRGGDLAKRSGCAWTKAGSVSQPLQSHSDRINHQPSHTKLGTEASLILESYLYAKRLMVQPFIHQGTLQQFHADRVAIRHFKRQWAMLAAKLTNMPAHMPGKCALLRTSAISQPEAAELLNVSRTSVRARTRFLVSSPSRGVDTPTVPAVAWATSVCETLAELRGIYARLRIDGLQKPHDRNSVESDFLSFTLGAWIGNYSTARP